MLRQALAAFLGDERFRRFVRQAVHRGHMRFWQEHEWGRFIAAHPEFVVEPNELEVALRICELHGQELMPDTVEVFHGRKDYTDRYIEARNKFFPYAACDPWSTEGSPFEGDRIEVWYCPACREAKAKW